MIVSVKPLFYETFSCWQYKIPCHGNFNLSYLTTVKRELNYRQRKIREALKIKKAKSDEKVQLFNRVDGTF